ncbi:MAG: mechanosensitive ion channel family protein [Bacilli bacterium]|nr:mechanosensitive ion channel family protein [Bacilli bacterium]MDD7315248.1 mechanosensitive ion channel family protein [Bacilli bacterium]
MESFKELSSKIANFFANNGLNILASILIFIIGFILIKLICKLLLKIVYATKIDNAIGGFIVGLLQVFLWLLLAFAIVSMLGLSGNSFLIAFSSVALAVGMALKDSLANIANGIVIIITKPFKKGDHIEIAGTEGIVRSVKILTTEIFTFDNKRIVLPNSAIVNGTLTNYTANPTRRVDIVIGVSYDSDIKLVKKVLTNLLDDHKLVLDVPSPTIILKAFSDSSLDFQLKFWVKTDDYYSALFDINEKIVEEFRKNNIEIPYNKLDVKLLNQKGDK